MDIKIIVSNRNLQLKDIPVGATFIFTADDEKIPHMKTSEIKNGYIASIDLRNGKLITGAYEDAKVISFKMPKIEIKI